VVYDEGKRKKLEAAHHRWIRKILHILWKDMVSNEKVRELTGQQLLGDYHPRTMTEIARTRLQNDNRHSCKGGDLLVSYRMQEE